MGAKHPKSLIFKIWDIKDLPHEVARQIMKKLEYVKSNHGSFTWYTGLSTKNETSETIDCT